MFAVQSCCGEGGVLQTNVTGVCGEHWPCSGHTGFTPAHGCVLSPSTLLSLHALYREQALSWCGSSFQALHKSSDSIGPAFCAFPGLCSSGNQEPDEHTLPGCGVPYPLHGPSLSFRVCWLGEPCVCSGELVSSCDSPGGCQPSEHQEVFG